MDINIDTIPTLATEMGQKLMAGLTQSTKRKNFFTALSEMLRTCIPFDRLCINLYDQEGGMLIYFTAAEGTIASTLSPVRPAEASTTVAGRVIATRKPVIITEFEEHFTNTIAHPIAEAGLTATMAFPLILDNEIIATLHCSFARKPEHVYEITSLLLALSPVVATCIGAILSLEQVRHRTDLQWQRLAPPTLEDDVICHSPCMREVMRKLDVVSKLNIPVLLLGETGTGKSLIAQVIHRRSQRRDAHFVKVNCPSLPETLFESELFGHAKGSFTGAMNKRVGRFELAHKGTLFLDEIAELSSEMQSKLLQVLEDSRFERVGESVPLAVDVRIIAATNVSMGDAMNTGQLRADLLYRLSPCTIELPPLRQRQEDIPPLVAALTAQLATSLGLPNITLRGPLLRPLQEYWWPGNVRELRNALSKMMILHSMRRSLTVSAVEEVLKENISMVTPRQTQASTAREPMPACPHRDISPAPEGEALPTLAEMEKMHIIAALRQTRGTLSGPDGAAALLGLPRTTLQHRIRKLGVKIED